MEQAMRQTELVLIQMGQDLQDSATALAELAYQKVDEGNPLMLEVFQDMCETNGCTDFAGLLRNALARQAEKRRRPAK
jgi:hypothetical protein